MVTIPFVEFPAFTEDIILDNTGYRFSFQWNTRGSFWTMHVADTAGAILISGVKIVIDYELLSRFPGRELPPGALFAVDPSQTLSVIGRDDFTDENVFLVYMTEEEFAAL